MDAKRFGQAGLVGVRGRMGRKLADVVDRRTRFDGEKIASLIGAYLFLSSVQRIVKTVRRAKRGETT
jgi:hypothetical protein